MENEGIMALPQGAAMPEDQGQMPMVTSADAYDAAQTAMGMVNPEELAVLKESLRQNMAELELTPSQLETLVEIFEYVSQNPGEYRTIRQELISQDFVDPEDLPEDYDPEFLGAMLVVLNELKMTAAQGANAAMMEGPPVEGMGMQPMAMAEGGLADMAALLAAQGRNGDKMLAHITPEEAEFLRERGGSGTINPATGLPEFFLKAIFKAVKSVVKSVVNVVKKVVKSPVGRILGTIALATVLGPTAIGATLGTAGTAALASGAVTLGGGGSIKDALISGAMGYIGGGGTIMGASPVSAVGGYMSGLAPVGSALNTGLATGVIGAGVGKLGGMSTQDALRMGLTSGASAAALAGLSNAQQQQAGRDAQFRSDYAGAGPGVGTAQDLLNAQAPGGAMPADYQSDFYRSIGIDPATMSPAGAGGSPTNIQIERGSLGMTGMADTARQAMSEPFNVAKDLYNTNLSPSRPGLPANAGIMQKYGPLALAGTAAMAATGGMEGEPANQNPAFNRDYTGMDYIRDNPNMFQGGLDTSYRRPDLPRGTIVDPSQMSRYSSIPIGQPGVVQPSGVTRSPAGVAQPYNVAGLYGVPLMYGQQPPGYAKGGELRPTEFPRKNGPIDGPGTGTSDSIPAMLSDGEFVFTAKAVRNAGGGSRRKGAARMYKLMKKLEGGPVKAK